MAKRTFLYTTIFTLIQICGICNCAVIQIPNADDRDYWHDYNVNYLKTIINSQETKTSPSIAKNVIYFVGDGMSFVSF